MTDEPSGYETPVRIYLVEDSAETGDVALGQIGGFFNEQEAEKCLALWSGEGGHARINMVPIHRRIEDWQYDR